MRTGLVGLVAAMVATPVLAQNTQIRVSGRVQIQYNTTSVSEGDVAAGESDSIASSTFETRRVRLGVRLTVNEWITGTIEPEYALGSLSLKQAWMNLAIDPAFEVRVGQFKKPFSLIQLTSSLDLPAIERGLRIRDLADAMAVADEAAGGAVLGTWAGDQVIGEEQELLEVFGYMGYELGVSAHGRLGAFDYDVGVFNGTAADTRDVNDTKSFAGRLRWHVPVSQPLTIGASASYREQPIAAAASPVDGTAWEADIELGEFRHAGPHLLAEATTGTNPGVDESFLGAQLMFSFYRPTTGRVEGLEPAVRLSWGDPDREVNDDAGLLVTPGFNVYLSGRTRLQLGWDVFVPQGDRFDTHHAVRAQAQLVF